MFISVIKQSHLCNKASSPNDVPGPSSPKI